MVKVFNDPNPGSKLEQIFNLTCRGVDKNGKDFSDNKFETPVIIAIYKTFPIVKILCPYYIRKRCHHSNNNHSRYGNCTHDVLEEANRVEFEKNLNLYFSK